jgi:transcriptional regulator with XRE-family HTH domain
LADDKVVGERLKWAREQQELTMQYVEDHGGPAKGYQSEVEKGKKTEVTAGKLGTWCRVLNVTPAFARGKVPRLEPKEPWEPWICRGLAGWVEPVIRQHHPELLDDTLLPYERVRSVLKLIATSEELPLPVLAWVMALDVKTMWSVIHDTKDSAVRPNLSQMKQVAILTAIPTRFFRYGELDLEE